VFCLIVLLTGTASAQFLGQMSPASIIDNGTGKAGAYFVAAEDAFAVAGSVRYGFGDYTEGRFRFGFIDQDGKDTDPHIIIGLDVKYLLWQFEKDANTGTAESSGYNTPFDLSLGFFSEYAQLEDFDVLGLGVSTIGSMPFRFQNGSVIEPYARFNLRYQHVSSDDIVVGGVTTREGVSDGDFEIGLNIGAMFSVTPVVDFTAEFQLDDQTAFMFGVDIAAF
jgi:hypothetical protein